MGVIIAMWSGPRNISTAMMRSWGSRPDTAVCDEPLYAHYLERTGLDHPGAVEVIAAGETDMSSVVRTLTTPPSAPASIFYQKHMAHHLLPGMDLGWIDGLRNALLIREPREMLTSLLRVLPNADLDATGLGRQVELFDRAVDRTGRALPVLDARDTLEDPAGMLESLCGALGVPYTESMLAWEPGPRPTDGVWARHWYASVEASTGFAPYRPKDEDVPARHAGLLRACVALYERLAAHKLRAPKKEL